MATGPCLQLGLILRVNNQGIALGCWGTRGSTRLNSATVRVRAFAEATRRSSCLDGTPDPSSSSGFIPYSLLPWSCLHLGRSWYGVLTLTHICCSAKVPFFTHSQQGEHEPPGEGVLSPWGAFSTLPTGSSVKKSPFMVLLETPRSQQTSFKWQHWILA